MLRRFSFYIHLYERKRFQVCHREAHERRGTLVRTEQHSQGVDRIRSVPSSPTAVPCTPVGAGNDKYERFFTT